MKWILILLLFSLEFVHAQNEQQPNILWIVCEDISPTFSFYGDSTAHTPVLDQLAAESLIYDNAFATVGVCGPSRSSIITGMYPTSIGTMHMRTAKDIQSWGKRIYKDSLATMDIEGTPIRQYAAVISDKIKCFPEYLRADGYYCTNNQKTDYQFAAPLSAWDENDGKAHWRNRPEGKPFFSVFNYADTHESRLWKNADQPLTVSPQRVTVPPYLPDTEVSRKDIARHYSNVEILDAKVGKLIQQLKADSLYDQTIIFFYSDHGGPLPRQKRAIYDSGLKVPFFVKGLKGMVKGRTDRLISFVDLAPTILSLADIQPPTHLEGKSFLGKYNTPPRKYVYGSSDRFDEHTDRIRIIRDKQFLYVRNFFPDLPGYKPLQYRENIPMMIEMLTLKENESLSQVQKRWFSAKDKEELYDSKNDPHNLHNLAADNQYKSVLAKMRSSLLSQLSQSPDLGQIPEAALIDLMWPDGKQPITATPVAEIKNQEVSISCSTPGASIVYRYINGANLSTQWQLYSEPIPIKKINSLEIIAERIGFQRSEPLRVK